MADPAVEAAWRAEVKRIGETQLGDALNSSSGGFAMNRRGRQRFVG
jgi:hypothetical protein